MIPKNNVFIISETEYSSIKEEIQKQETAYLGEADGTKIKAEIKSSFFQEIGHAIEMPESKIGEITNTTWFIDEMEDLWWFNDGDKYDSYYIAIKGGLSHLKSSSEFDWENFYTNKFKDLIKYWTVEAPKVAVGGTTKDFTIFFVENDR